MNKQKKNDAPTWAVIGRHYGPRTKKTDYEPKKRKRKRKMSPLG
jgi:hypothetical protein